MCTSLQVSALGLAQPDLAGDKEILHPLIEHRAEMQWQCRIRDHPDVNFRVVINPGSGPGPSSLPDANYTRDIPKLTSKPNVRVLGYVATTYATRDQLKVLRDVETYANWPKVSANIGLAVHGIFFDETPQQYTASAEKYLQELTASVRELPGLGPDNFVRILSYPYFPFFFSLFLFYPSPPHVTHAPVQSPKTA
jgi:hypothetical protein